MPNAMTCSKCHILVKRQPNDESFWCSCGRHWKAPREEDAEEPEIDAGASKVSVEIPYEPKHEKIDMRGRTRGVTPFAYEARGDYLRRHKLSEAEILLDDGGREYFIEDNFKTGESTRRYLPPRLKNQKKA